MGYVVSFFHKEPVFENWCASTWTLCQVPKELCLHGTVSNRSDIHPAIDLKALKTQFPDSFHTVTQYFCKWNMPFRVSDYNYNRAVCPVHLIILRACGEEHKIWSSPLRWFLSRLITLSLLCPDIILCDHCSILNITQNVSSGLDRLRCYCTDFLLCENINVITVPLFCVILFCAERVTSTDTVMCCSLNLSEMKSAVLDRHRFCNYLFTIDIRMICMMCR
jgi:hypothetical protein